MREVAVIGIGMHPFGKFINKSLKDLGRTAVWAAIQDAGVTPKDIQVAYVGNAMAGLITGQECVRGQLILRDAGIGGIPITNVENACASSSTAFRECWIAVGSGLYDVGLALGVEKLFCNNTPKSIRAMSSASDVELEASMGMQFTSLYAMNIRKYMKEYDVSVEHLARVVVKNSKNGSLNPYAQFRKPLSLEEVLNSPVIADPLRLYMCSSMSDGAAAAILCAKEVAHKFTSKPLVTVAASAMRSGMFRPPDSDTPDSVTLTCRQAYEMAGVGPEDIDVTEVHDAMSPAELISYEELGFCAPGQGKELIDQGRTEITGDMPVNPSGGLAARGHPVGATGIAQIAEIVWQLRGECGPRQVREPKVGLAQNSGGRVEGDAGAVTIHILTR